MNFFETVKAEMRNPVGLHKLVWKVNWGQYPMRMCFVDSNMFGRDELAFGR